VSGKPVGASPNTLQNAIRTGLIRVVGEQRYADRVEELDRMADGVLVEVKRHQSTNVRKRPTIVGIGPYQKRLLQLLADGLDAPTIATRLQREHRQVVEDIRALFALLHVDDPLGAVVAGYDLGILTPAWSAR
jgi:DNA-binding NarL/FixJ family response regulator